MPDQRRHDADHHHTPRDRSQGARASQGRAPVYPGRTAARDRAAWRKVWRLREQRGDDYHPGSHHPLGSHSDAGAAAPAASASAATPANCRHRRHLRGAARAVARGRQRGAGGRRGGAPPAAATCRAPGRPRKSSPPRRVAMSRVAKRGRRRGTGRRGAGRHRRARRGRRDARRRRRARGRRRYFAHYGDADRRVRGHGGVGDELPAVDRSRDRRAGRDRPRPADAGCGAAPAAARGERAPLARRIRRGRAERPPLSLLRLCGRNGPHPRRCRQRLKATTARRTGLRAPRSARA